MFKKENNILALPTGRLYSLLEEQFSNNGIVLPTFNHISFELISKNIIFAIKKKSIWRTNIT